MGIDFGTVGLSAVLLNAQTGDRFPISWLSLSQSPTLRFPSVAYSGPTTTSVSPIVIGASATAFRDNPTGIFLKNFKAHLNLGIPFYSGDRHWQPMLQLSAEQRMSLYWVCLALQTLLATLTPQSVHHEGDALEVSIQTNLPPDVLKDALSQLKGVILGCPADWGDPFRFNLREAVLGAKLVGNSEQIFFLEDGIAAFLGSLSFISSNDSGRGVLIVNAGATTTELALVRLPESFQDLTNADFTVRSFPYGGYGIEQDLVSLLYPQIPDQPALDFPEPGEPDSEKRMALDFALQSPLGLALLEAAGYIKTILQHQDEFRAQLDGVPIVVRRRDLESRILAPYIGRLNQEVNALLAESGIAVQAIAQSICTGGTARWKPLQDWLEQKIAFSTLRYVENITAIGLASLPLYPQVLNVPQQQYSDYFLLSELLGVFPERSLLLPEVVQLLERQGINTRVCLPRIAAFLEGELPKGNVPGMESSWVVAVSSFPPVMPLFEVEGDRYYLDSERRQQWSQYLNQIRAGTVQNLEEPLLISWRKQP